MSVLLAVGIRYTIFYLNKCASQNNNCINVVYSAMLSIINTVQEYKITDTHMLGRLSSLSPWFDIIGIRFISKTVYHYTIL